MFILGLVCARGGSKGLPKKNIRILHGKPLIYYAIQQLKNSPSVNDVIVSTDDKEIAEAAKKAGAKVPFIRPKELAGDNTGKFPVLQHAVKEYERITGQKVGILADRDPTNPTIRPEDIEGAIALLKKDPTIDTVISAYKAHLNPYFNMMEMNSKGFLEISKKPQKEIQGRQDAPPVYQLHSGVICMWRDSVINGKSIYTDKVKLYEVPSDRSVMIDTELDFQFAEFLMGKGMIDSYDDESN